MRFLAHERDRVDADPLAAEVVPIGLADRAQFDLRHLCTAADHDHALAEDLAERLARLDLGHAGHIRQQRRRRVAIDVADLEVEDAHDVRFSLESPGTC